MKTIGSFIIFLSIIMSFTCFGQDINPELYQNTWQDDETRTMYGYDITKIFGQFSDSPVTYNYSPITAISFKNIDDIKNDFEKIAKEENWSDEVLQENLKNLDNKGIKGQFQIYLTRYTENNANFKWFFLIIRGIDDKEKLWEYYLPYQAPNNPVNNGWWNYTTVDVPIDLPDDFLVYFNDKLSNFLSDFKFKFEKDNNNK